MEGSSRAAKKACVRRVPRARARARPVHVLLFIVFEGWQLRVGERREIERGVARMHEELEQRRCLTDHHAHQHGRTKGCGRQESLLLVRYEPTRTDLPGTCLMPHAAPNFAAGGQGNVGGATPM